MTTKPFWRFTLERVNNTIRWTKVQREKRKLPSMTATTENKRKGCGTSFEWGKLPPIEEGKIKELFQVKTMEEAKQLIRDANYTQRREEYARNVDVSRYK